MNSLHMENLLILLSSQSAELFRICLVTGDRQERSHKTRVFAASSLRSPAASHSVTQQSQEGRREQAQMLYWELSLGLYHQEARYLEATVVTSGLIVWRAMCSLYVSHHYSSLM